jgi:hypothetical protein
MRRPKQRPARPSVTALESRLLLSGLSGTWLGQDAHDYVGPSSVPGPDGVQDIHISISGIPTGRQIAFADFQGLGGGDWEFNGPNGPWAAVVLQQPGASAADMYLEPYQTETGRPFQLSVRYDDGSTDGTWVSGGTADPNLRMPGAALTVQSATQNGQDFVGTGPDVGPDGFQDLDLRLTGLSPTVGITSLVVAGPAGPTWAFGSNPGGLSNASLIRNPSDPTQGDLYIQPTGDLQGQKLTLSLSYDTGKSDSASYVVTTSTPGNLPMPAPPTLPSVRTGANAQWLGQDGLNLTGAGDVHLGVSGLPAGRTVVAATLNDSVGALWAFASSAAGSYYIDPYTPNLGFRAGSNGTADVTFQPIRDETGSSLSLRLQFDDGSIAILPVIGGLADVGLRVAGPAALSVVAHPDDDLNALANQYGTVQLSPGTYNLSQPLVLNHPVTITAPSPGVTLLFAQPANATPWTAAILVHASHTTLNGFAVRFSGPVNWNQSVNYGPAVIGSSDNVNSGFGDPKIDLTFTGLDVQSPPASSSWEQAPSLFRLDTAESGLVAGNTLDGGTTEVAGGPWQILDNNYVGTVANTYTPTAFASHHGHDVEIEGNHVQPQAGSGKTYRFLVQNQGGQHDTIANNTVIGVGPMDSDNLPDTNSAEILLTEDYDLHFEGAPAAISPDGTVLQIPTPQGYPARAGDVVAILSGPNAGQWRQIAQAINTQTYLMSSPLPSGSYAISISSGFVGETYSGNTIDARGSSTSVEMDLTGAHFGTQILNNTLLGGHESFRFEAPPSNNPNGFGWSHTPFLGAVIAGNTIVDSLKGGTITVEHSSSMNASQGRVYFSGQLINTTIRWTDAFLAADPTPVALTIGDPGALDTGELVISMSGNAIQTNPSHAIGNTVSVYNGLINGLPLSYQTMTLLRLLPPAPTGLALVDDSGVSNTDGVTNDGRLKFNPVAGASGYEYQVGTSGAFVPVASPTGFLPAGLAQGSNTVSVRAIDSFGNRGPVSSMIFTLDTAPPVADPPALAPGNDTGRSATDDITNIGAPTYLVSGAGGDQIVLDRNGVAVAKRTGPGFVSEPVIQRDGTYTYTVVRTDLAGNTSTSPGLAVTIDRTPPLALPPVLTPASDSGASQTDGVTNVASPTFAVSGAAADLIALYRNGTLVAQRIGPGTLTEPTALADSIYRYTAQRTDIAGNVSFSPVMLVTIDRTPPPLVGGLAATSLRTVRFVANELGDTYAYRVGSVGPYTSVGYATSFSPAGLLPGLNLLQVHAVDLAGNVGPDASVILNTAPTIASGVWLGQDGHDLVGPTWVLGPDGIQDIHIALAGLRAGQAIASIDVRGLGGGEWMYRGPAGGPWVVALVRANRATTGDLYFSPYQIETGRPFQVDIRYGDGQHSDFWVSGGYADPSRRAGLNLKPAGTVKADVPKGPSTLAHRTVRPNHHPKPASGRALRRDR